MAENFSLLPADSTTRRHLLPGGTVVGHGLASGASIASSGLGSFSGGCTGLWEAIRVGLSMSTKMQSQSLVGPAVSATSWIVDAGAK